MKLRRDLISPQALLCVLRRLQIVRLDVDPTVGDEVYLIEASPRADRHPKRVALGCPDALRRSTLTGHSCSPRLAPIALDAVHASAPPVPWEARNE